MAEYQSSPPRGGPKPGDPVRCRSCGSGVMLIKDETLTGAVWGDDLMIRGGTIKTYLECAKCGAPMKISARYRNNRRVF